MSTKPPETSRRRPDQSRELRQFHAEVRGAVRIEDHLQLVVGTGVDAHGRDARHGLDPGPHEFLDALAVRLDRARRAGQQLHEEPGQRLVRAAAAVVAERDRRRGRVARQRRQLVHAADHLDQRTLHVGADREAQVQERVARVRERVQLLEAGQSLQRAFLRLEDLGLDFGWCRRAPAGLHRDDRRLDVGEQLHRHPEQADDAEQADQCRDHGDDDGLAYGNLGKVHGPRLWCVIGALSARYDNGEMRRRTHLAGVLVAGVPRLVAGAGETVVIGQFLGVVPIAEGLGAPGGFNCDAYVGSNPIPFTDPSGYAVCGTKEE